METAKNCLSDYVEVMYFEKGQYKNRKLKFYEKDKAKTIFQRTVNKAKEDEITALICLRDENHLLIKSEWLERNKL